MSFTEMTPEPTTAMPRDGIARDLEPTEELDAHLVALLERTEKNLYVAREDAERAVGRVHRLEEQLERLRRARHGLGTSDDVVEAMPMREGRW